MATGLLAALCLVMLVVAANPASRAAAQTAPLPYRELEVTIPVPAGHTLSGTLTLPAGTGQFPAVVLISGSGAQDRDETIPIVPGYRPFRVIGDHAIATSADFADDAEAAWRFLRARRDIDPFGIGLMGHSEGGFIAAVVAARNPRVAFVVSMAGPGINGYDALIVQNERVYRALGLSPEEISGRVATARAMLDLIRSEQWDRLRAVVLDAVKQQIAALPPERQATLPPPERIVDGQMTFYRGWMRFFLVHNPAKEWARVRIPVLALFGVLDVQVDLWQNRAGLLAALQRAGNSDVTVVVPHFLDTLSGWILDRFGGH